jgi:murein peptide amidase A
MKKTNYISLLIALTLISCTSVSNRGSTSPALIVEKQNDQDHVTKDSTMSIPAAKAIAYTVKTHTNSEMITSFCKTVDLHFEKYQWGTSNCSDYSWHHVRKSHLGHPLAWFVFNQTEGLETNTTVILCGVHGDEITPIKFCFDIMDDLRKNPKLLHNGRVVIVPLVTPDSFFIEKPTRTNARGVDVNRNFPTRDWNHDALRLWEHRYRKDKRRYPGPKAMSEQETIFQVNLIQRYKPNKIISVHAPLSLLDYDGPAFTEVNGQAAKELLIQMSDKSGNYKVSNYPFFPGSLGNWAGQERSIPTYTLELPNSDWHKTERYFSMFREAIHLAIKNDLSKTTNLLKKQVSDHDH